MINNSMTTPAVYRCRMNHPPPLLHHLLTATTAGNERKAHHHQYYPCLGLSGRPGHQSATGETDGSLDWR